MKRTISGLLTFASATILLNACGSGDKGVPKPVDFVADIKPLLQKRCVTCHNTATLIGEINLENSEHAFGKSARGHFIVEGEPEKSLLYTVTLAPHGKRELPPGIDTPMPDRAPELSDGEKSLLRRWITEGAKWPDGPEGHVKPLDPQPGKA